MGISTYLKTAVNFFSVSRNSPFYVVCMISKKTKTLIYVLKIDKLDLQNRTKKDIKGNFDFVNDGRYRAFGYSAFRKIRS